VIYCVCVFPYMATLLSLYCPCCYAWFQKYTRLCLSRFPPSWHGWYESLFWYSRLFTHFKKLAFVRVTVVEYGWHASQFWYSRLFTHNMFVSNINTKKNCHSCHRVIFHAMNHDTTFIYCKTTLLCMCMWGGGSQQPGGKQDFLTTMSTVMLTLRVYLSVCAMTKRSLQ
jgi:hypothetical protein